MGCVNDKLSLSNIRPARSAISAVWNSSTVKVASPKSVEPIAEEWADVMAVTNLLRSQGTDIDVLTFASERMFYRSPRTKLLFVEAGIVNPEEDIKTDLRFRAHMREFNASMNKLIDLKNTDHEAFYSYTRELKDLHLAIKGFDAKFYEVFAQCLDISLDSTMGPAVSSKQKAAFRKFTMFLYKILAEGSETAKESAPAEADKQAPTNAVKQAPIQAIKKAFMPTVKPTPMPAGKKVPMPVGKQAPTPAGKQAPTPAGKQASTPDGKQDPMPAVKQASNQDVKQNNNDVRTRQIVGRLLESQTVH